jgi:site-specific recombinase XerD
VLSEAEYTRLVNVVQYETRNRAIVELLLQTGLRLGEVSRLRVSDVSLPAKLSRDPGFIGAVVVHGKGRKTRTVTLSCKACRALKAYLDSRKHLDDPHLFLTKFGRGMGPRSIQQMVEQRVAEARIQGALVHTLRHTFATHSVRKDTKLDVVRQVLGHSSLATTSIYVDPARDVMDRELQENAL